MAQETTIEWTDATWNVVTGCSKVSPGCAHCYAERFAERFRGVAGHPYEQGFAVRLWPTRLMHPSQWISPRRIFVCSMADLFQDEIPDAFLDQVFATMALAPWHTFQLLTKRPERMAAYLMGQDDGQEVAERITERVLAMDPDALQHLGHTAFDIDRDEDGKIDGITLNWPLSNLWLGVSVENETWTRRLGVLCAIPAAVHFVSLEPLLGPVDIEPWLPKESHHFMPSSACPRCNNDCNDTWECSVCAETSRRALAIARQYNAHTLQWVIVGGESGPQHRPIEQEWVRTIRDQCVEAQVPFFFKQWGGLRPKSGGNLLDGRVWQEFPRC